MSEPRYIIAAPAEQEPARRAPVLSQRTLERAGLLEPAAPAEREPRRRVVAERPSRRIRGRSR